MGTWDNSIIQNREFLRRYEETLRSQEIESKKCEEDIEK